MPREPREGPQSPKARSPAVIAPPGPPRSKCSSAVDVSKASATARWTTLPGRNPKRLPRTWQLRGPQGRFCPRCPGARRHPGRQRHSRLGMGERRYTEAEM